VFFHRFFDPNFTPKPLHIVVNLSHFSSEPQYVIRIILSAVECLQSDLAKARLLGHSWHETYSWLLRNQCYGFDMGFGRKV